MKTLFNTGDTVYIPVKIKMAMCKEDDEILYQIWNYPEEDELIPEEKCFTLNQMVSHQRAKAMVHVDSDELDYAKEKILELEERIKEANSLLDELAEKNVSIKVTSIRT